MGATREDLSESAGGRQIKIGQEASPGTKVHETLVPVTTKDEVVMYGCNHHPTDTILTKIQFGGVSDPDDIIPTPIPPNSGEVPLLVGRQLSGDGAAVREVRVFVPAGYADYITIGGHVNRLAPDA